MKVHLRKVRDQVMVITGATSGIGLVTARMAARKGAQLVLAARNEEALRKLTDEVNQAGCEAVSVTADVGRESDVRRIAERAISKFGGFDTWVNNAGVSIYGRLDEIAIEDHRRLFETNFWGVVYGSFVAIEHLRHRGGALINIGSTVSDRAIPLQGMYSASKHAVKGFTDALRMELEQEGAPIAVTLIKPGAIDTPYTKHAKNYLSVEPTNPPPLYAPETVAKAIIHCAERPEREVFVGAGGKMISALGKYAPWLTDKIMEKAFFSMQQTDQPSRGRDADSLHHPSNDLEERGGEPRTVFESSLYTRASLHPVLSGVLAAGAGYVLSSLLSNNLRSNSKGRQAYSQESALRSDEVSPQP